MRQLTESERIARDVAKSSRDVPYLADDLEHYIFDMGFTTALDHSADQITAYILSLEGLTAERDELRAALRPFADNAEVWEENESHFVLVYSRRGVKGKPDLMIMVGDLLEARRTLREPREETLEK